MAYSMMVDQNSFYGRRQPGYWPSRVQEHSTLNNINTFGGDNNGIISPFLGDRSGFGVDLNGDGRFERGKDAVLAFDLNGDGKIDDAEVARSKNILNSVNKPTISLNLPKLPCQQNAVTNEIANPDYAEAKRLGLTDGPINANTLARAGARVMLDKSSSPFAHEWESHSVFDVPRADGSRGVLASLDPVAGHAVTLGRGWSHGW